MSFSDARRTDHERKPISPERTVRQWDILINSTGVGTLGRIAQVNLLPEPATVDSHVTIVRPNPEVVDPRFLGFVVRALESDVEALAEGSTGQTELSRARLAALEIPIAPQFEQRAIAHVLGSMDDKIELNRRMSVTLEAVARALFKSWFVDFDPVCAKANGCDPGVPKALADLFPDRLVDSELGAIPEGWGGGTLADLAALNPEVWSKQTRPLKINYVDLSNTKWGRIEAVFQYTQEDAPSRAQRVLRPNDTIVGTVRPGNGSYAFVADGGLTGSTGFAVLRPRSADFAELVYLAATARENIEALSHLADGAAYPAVRPEVVAATQIVRASDEVLAHFSHCVRLLFAKLAQNERETRTLTALRDTLLPKLISGELRLKDPETFLGRVG